MKSFYILFLLSALILTNPTSANASPLEKKWDKECCPVSVCVFKQGDNPLLLPTSQFGLIGAGVGYNANTFNGILSFTESPKNKLQISGFIDIHGVVNGAGTGFPPFGQVEI